MNISTSPGTALVTGASSGIGAVYADRLARRGHDLLLVARRGDELRRIAAELTHATGRRIETIEADLNDAAGLARVEHVLRTNADITTLVNNAGVGAAKPLIESDIAEMDRMIALNVVALTHLAHAAVPGFVERGGGTLINIASIVAIAPEMLNGVYGGSKAYVLALSQSLHHELGNRGLRVQAVLPGATATDFWHITGGVQNLPQQIVMTTEAMVDAALAGLDLGELVTIPSLPESADWEAYENARKALVPNLSRTTPAERYAVARTKSA